MTENGWYTPITRSEQWDLFNERKSALWNKGGNPWSRERYADGSTNYQEAPMLNTRHRFSISRRYLGWRRYRQDVGRI